MKKTNSPWKVLLYASIIAVMATTLIVWLENTIGLAATFGYSICLIPILFVWCLFTLEVKRDKQFNEREQAWRNSSHWQQRDKDKYK